MPPKFGTSGLRGLVTDLTDPLVTRYTQAFLTACPGARTVLVGADLRASSPRIAAAVGAAIAAQGKVPVSCGVVPTPALALAAQHRGASAIMVTGSHIPQDRNGLKFYTRDGEITKADEEAILAALGAAPTNTPTLPLSPDEPSALEEYATRYTSAFRADSLDGWRIGVYQHSTAARDLLPEVLAALGATPVPLGRSDDFIPVDTEALDPDTETRLAEWARAHDLDAVISADGDADRPMVADAAGQIIPGDLLGQVTARYLGASTVVTPVSSNTGVAAMPEFGKVLHTRIGSPFVIAGMVAENRSPGARTVGYEANGGFLLGFSAALPGGGTLVPLMTRDALLPILATLCDAASRGLPLSALTATLPRRATAADRLTEIPTSASAALIAALDAGEARAMALMDGLPPVTATDRTDGLRMTLADGRIVHLRPSGNAPEFRCYAEADTPDAARGLMQLVLGRLQAHLGGDGA